MRQHDEESVIAFVGRLRAASERCEFSSTDVDSIENCQLRDQLIVGPRRNDIRRELLKSSSLTLAKATTDGVAMESSITDSKLLDPFSVSSLPSSVNKIISVRKYSSGTSSSKKNVNIVARRILGGNPIVLLFLYNARNVENLATSLPCACLLASLMKQLMPAWRVMKTS